MKKLALLFGIAAMAFTSCTGENADANNNDIPGNGPLVKKVIFTDDEDDTETNIVTYNGNKIVKIEGADYKEIYTYSGDLIVKTESYDENVLEGKTEYTYEENKLKTEIEEYYYDGNTHKEMRVYTYINDNTVQVNEYIYNGGVETLAGTEKLTFASGNLVKIERFSTSGSNEGVDTFEFDDKNNPLKNITGFSKLINKDSNKNNITKSTYVYNQETTVTTFEYTYNADGFPTKKIQTEVYNGEIDVQEVEFVY